MSKQSGRKFSAEFKARVALKRPELSAELSFQGKEGSFHVYGR